MDAASLYALPSEDYIAARDEAPDAARAAGDPAAATALKALRRPSVAAWLVNRLTVGQPGLLDEPLELELGPAAAEAQAGGDATALRTLGAQRRAPVEAVAYAAAQGRTVSAALYARSWPPSRPSSPGPSRRCQAGLPAKARTGKLRTQTAATAVLAAERGPHEAAGRLDHAVKRASGRTAAAAARQEAESAVTAAQSVVPRPKTPPSTHEGRWTRCAVPDPRPT